MAALKQVLVQPPCVPKGSNTMPSNQMAYSRLVRRSIFKLPTKKELLDELQDTYNAKFWEYSYSRYQKSDAFKVGHHFKVIAYYNKKRTEAKFTYPNEEEKEQNFGKLYMAREPALFRYDRISSAPGREALR